MTNNSESPSPSQPERGLQNFSMQHQSGNAWFASELELKEIKAQIWKSQELIPSSDSHVAAITSLKPTGETFDLSTNARIRFNRLINDLKASSLLLESEFDRVRIHDYVRDMAKSITCRTRPTYGVKRYTKVNQWPGMDELRKCHQIILTWSYIYKLPEKLVCPKLELLQLENIGDNLEVPDDFFSGMIELKVVSLYGMMFAPSLPSSLLLLTKIRTLNLAGCVLEDISIVAELKSLEILSLERSDITELPKEIRQLTNLRMLNLANCSRLRFIPANLISSLTCLEELYMGNCFIQWDVKGSNDQSKNASLEELRSLSHLTALDIMTQDASVWPRDLLVFEKLERYNIYIGDMWKWSLDWSGNASEPNRILKLNDSRGSSILLDRGFNSLLNSAEDMCILIVALHSSVSFRGTRIDFAHLRPDLSKLAAQHIMELEPANATPYVVLSNMYSASGQKIEGDLVVLGGTGEDALPDDDNHNRPPPLPSLSSFLVMHTCYSASNNLPFALPGNIQEARALTRGLHHMWVLPNKTKKWKE
ncbi:LRR receptor-like kinase family protein, putative [Medicago truncatula]|uniref:LRR receptor-like kinase family protein, putative n=1 Tax=Medicago truncatula TaxID=3880 RepID=A0A072V9G4_MEDTR|nr:LRR receptor-like kinase family protein, putative [Medicago truncatula]